MRRASDVRAEKAFMQAMEAAAIARMFKAVEVIDAAVTRYPNRGQVQCPNCKGTLTFINTTRIKGGARCSTPGCVDFMSNY